MTEPNRTGTRIARVVLAGLSISLLAPAAHAGDIASGRALANQCAVCHGLDGMAVQPDAPNIGGESEIYLINQLRAFRDGERQHQQMSIIAQGLSDKNIEDVAAYFSAIEIEVVSVPEIEE